MALFGGNEILNNELMQSISYTNWKFFEWMCPHWDSNRMF